MRNDNTDTLGQFSFKSRSVQTRKTPSQNTPLTTTTTVQSRVVCTLFFICPSLHLFTRKYFSFVYAIFFLGGDDGNFYSYTFTNLHSVRNVGQSKSETNSLSTGQTSEYARFQTNKKLINNEIRNHYGRRFGGLTVKHFLSL